MFPKNSSCLQFGKLLQDCIHKLAVSRHMSIASVSMKHTHTGTQYTCMPTHTHTHRHTVHLHANTHTHTGTQYTCMQTHTGTQYTCMQTHTHRHTVHLHANTHTHTGTQYTCMQTRTHTQAHSTPACKPSMCKHTHTEAEVINMFDWSTSLHQKGMCEITNGYEGRRWHWQGTTVCNTD